MASGYERAYARVLSDAGQNVDVPLGDLSVVASQPLVAT
jgi:hypothetical protein